jgi:N-acetylglucosamine-6-phosphate deacetylase
MVFVASYVFFSLRSKVQSRAFLLLLFLHQTLGAVVSMDACVRNYRRFTECSCAEAIEAASSRPASLIFGKGTLVGTLKPGAPADLVLLDATALSVLGVFLGGERAWSPNEGDSL